jgi:hypothetical protein
VRTVDEITDIHHATQFLHLKQRTTGLLQYRNFFFTRAPMKLERNFNDTSLEIFKFSFEEQDTCFQIITATTAVVSSSFPPT